MFSLFKNLFFSSNEHVWDLNFFSKLDFSIIINVGARYDEKNDIDKNLIKYFPKSLFILIEPNKECEDKIHITYREKKINFKFFNYCLDSSSRKVNFYVRGSKTSIFKSLAMQKKKIKYNRVEKLKTYTFDEKFYNYILKNKNKKILMKIDTEGSELEIIKGAKKSLKHIDALIFEIDNLERFEGGCNNFNLSKYLCKFNFFASKTIISNIVKTNKNKKFINYQDILFLKKNITWPLEE